MKLGTIAYLERHHDEKNMHRFYRLSISATLFGEFALVREWGRVGSKRVQRKEDWYKKETEALAAGLKLQKQKCRKGYQLR